MIHMELIVFCVNRLELMTRLKRRKLDKIRGGLGAIDSKFADREDTKNFKIKELENQMDNELFDTKKKLGPNNQRNFVKRMNKTHKGLR